MRRHQGVRALPAMRVLPSMLLLLAGLLATPAARAATSPVEMLPDQSQEARAREIGRGLRCLVCQNQSIDDSDADLARDLRRLVREQVAAGRSDEQIQAHLVERYGAFILLKPPFEAATVALWLAPPLLLLLGGALVATVLRRARSLAEPGDLSAEERARLAALLAEPPPSDVASR